MAPTWVSENGVHMTRMMTREQQRRISERMDDDGGLERV